MKIEDNFLEQKDFIILQPLMTAPKTDLPWFYNDFVVHEDELDKFQFVHIFYNHDAPRSIFFQTLQPIIDKIKPISLWRIKANLLTRTPNIVENKFHVDIASWNFSSEILKQWTTSIFYMNTNNGYTKFEDGSVVESVANRMITFSTNMEHAGTSCTDEKTRVVINFNYFAH